ncbi:MAG: T9SS type A sorting domain-containing protein [Bacteroidales bacterium]|nr:T9SS type A sorting domain-containing protein [Bacteroidales bacterium]
MQRIILLITFSCFTIALYSQFPVQQVSILDTECDSIGNTYYDKQTYATMQNRIYCFDDGTIGATYTIGFDFPNFPYDRGTGYNYFDGSGWGPFPTVRIESQRAGWSSYAPLGENGEIVVAHLSGAVDVGLLINMRETKGTGDWIESLYHGPPGHESVIYPSMVTGGENHNSIYLLSLTRPYVNGGSPYKELDGALLYSRSTDGGESWDILNHVLPGMDSSEYTGFTRDSYTFAKPKDNIVAFVTGSFQHDLFLMKSTDYGQTFEKTIIWDHPYDLITPTFYTDTFYCVDGSIDVALDVNGNAHVVFGIMRTYYNMADWKYFKLTDGVGYWNETMPSFSSNVNALDPTCGPESELIVDESLIGWAQDLNGNGTIDYLDDPTPPSCFYFSLGISSMVQLVADESNRLFLIYSSFTEMFDNGTMNYRRLFLRSSLNGGQSWGQFYHYDEENLYSIFNEYAFPSCSSFSDDYLYLTFMVDNEPGIYCPGDPCPPGESYIYFAKIPKDEIVGIKQNNQTHNELEVSQNFPNPFTETTTIKVNLQKPADLKLDVINILGQKVYETGLMSAKLGINTLTVKAEVLTPGIYFYTVIAGESSATKKMIIN